MTSQQAQEPEAGVHWGQRQPHQTGIAMITVTPLYGGLLAIWFLILSVRVILGRVGPGKPSLGDGGSPDMLRRIRGHANFSEYVPLFVLLIALLELSGQPKWVLHILGSVLLAGRLLHGYAFSFTQDHVLGRSAGIVLTFTSLAFSAALCVFIGMRAL
jgi:uncharacterized membrane protein YecN with MAPEG domain